MSYLLFDTLSASAPLALSGSQVYTFQRPLGSLSAATGYRVNVVGSVGVYAVSATNGATLLSSMQLSGTTAGLFNLSSANIAAGDTLVITIAHVSGDVVPAITFNIDPHSTVVAGEFAFVGATYTNGVGNVSGVTLNPYISATTVSPVAGILSYTTTWTVSAVTTSTTLSTDQVSNLRAAPNTYIVQGDTFGLRTTVTPFSALDSTVVNIGINFVDSNFVGTRALQDHLRLRNQGTI